MKNPRIVILTVLALAAVALATVSIFAYAYGGSATTNTYPNTTAYGANGYYPNEVMGGDWNGMMSGMMGGNWGPSSSVQTPTAAQNTILPLVGFVALIGAATTGIGGVTYYLTGFKTGIAKRAPKSTVENSPQSITTPYTSVSKTLTSEERKVLDILVSHKGKYLQKYLRAETGLSRLKIHRIVTRLAERGIVSLEKSGNTNEVHLSSWLQTKTETNKTTTKGIDIREIKVEA